MLHNPSPFGAFENGAPRGDEARHLDEEEIVAGYHRLPPAPRSRGTLRSLHVRMPGGERRAPQRVTLDPEAGVFGDRWRPGKVGTDNQITLCRYDVAVLQGNGQDLGLFGDNLMVDLDLSVENLPPGTELRIGDVLLEVTPEPHNGCAKYHQRFGMGALRFTARSELRHLRLRGIHARVLLGGEIAIGDPIAVQRL